MVQRPSHTAFQLQTQTPPNLERSSGVCAIRFMCLWCKAQPAFAHTHPAFVAQHQMIRHLHIEEFVRGNNLPRDLHIFGLGVGSPEGCWCATIRAGLLWRIASLAQAPTAANQHAQRDVAQHRSGRSGDVALIGLAEAIGRPQAGHGWGARVERSADALVGQAIAVVL